MAAAGVLSTLDGVLMAMTIPGLAILIIVVAFAEVGYRKVTGRTGLPWMRGSEDENRSAAAIGFEQFGSVFESGKKHEFEQRQSVLMHRENPGDGTDGMKIDLTTGKARLPKL
ncbi:DUF6191 domain-containing protein [Nocardia sp. NPDC056100]|uniref:DUF6191 domain-containing protein n=1 Tax=Nocardia sp. NPDC056100 TaxID=3345712 RepID=UPI0035D5A304